MLYPPEGLERPWFAMLCVMKAIAPKLSKLWVYSDYRLMGRLLLRIAWSNTFVILTNPRSLHWGLAPLTLLQGHLSQLVFYIPRENVFRVQFTNWFLNHSQKLLYKEPMRGQLAHNSGEIVSSGQWKADFFCSGDLIEINFFHSIKAYFFSRHLSRIRLLGSVFVLRQ